MNYAADQRLRFIDLMLLLYGHINRKALIEMYGIASACASHDLKRYNDLYPGNMVYDKFSKTYVKTPDFERAYQ